MTVDPIKLVCCLFFFIKSGCCLPPTQGSDSVAYREEAPSVGLNSNWARVHAFVEIATPYTKGGCIFLSFWFVLILKTWLVACWRLRLKSMEAASSHLNIILDKGSFFENTWARIYLVLSLPSTFPLSLLLRIGKWVFPENFIGFYGVDRWSIVRGDTEKKCQWCLITGTVIGLMSVHLRLLNYYFSKSYAFVGYMHWLIKKKAYPNTWKEIGDLALSSFYKLPMYIKAGGAVLSLLIICVGVRDGCIYYKNYCAGWKLLAEELRAYYRNLDKIQKKKSEEAIKKLICYKKRTGASTSALPEKLQLRRFDDTNAVCAACILYNNTEVRPCFRLQNEGFYSICWGCYNIYYESRQHQEKRDNVLARGADKPEKSFDQFNETTLGQFFSYLRASTLKQGLIPFNLESGIKDITATDMAEEKSLKSYYQKRIKADPFLTLQDLYDLGAPEELLKEYRERTELLLGYCTNYCFLCGDKKHQTSACPQKERVHRRLAHWYARYAPSDSAFYLIYYVKLLVKFLWYGRFNETLLRQVCYNYLQIEQPCPYCGFLTDKDDQCDHIAACPNCLKEWYYFIGKKKRGLSYDHPFTLRVYSLPEGVTPFKSPELLGSRCFKEEKD